MDLNVFHHMFPQCFIGAKNATFQGFGGDETHGLTTAGDALPCHGIVDGEANDGWH